MNFLTALALVIVSVFVIAAATDKMGQGRDETTLPYQQCLDKCRLLYDEGFKDGMRQEKEICDAARPTRLIF